MELGFKLSCQYNWVDHRFVELYNCSDLKACNENPCALCVVLHSCVSSDDWVLDVPDEYETRYLLCYEHLDPVPDSSETCSED